MQAKSSKATLSSRTKSPEGSVSRSKFKARSEVKKQLAGALAESCEVSSSDPGRPEVQRKQSSFLGVFSKRGRSKSASRERGVLGKEGARVVLSEG